MIECFSVRDDKSELYLNPFWCSGPVEASRMISQVVNDPKSQLAQFPDDYSLYSLCTLEEKTGDITKTNKLITQINVLQKINAKNNS